MIPSVFHHRGAFFRWEGGCCVRPELLAVLTSGAGLAPAGETVYRLRRFIRRAIFFGDHGVILPIISLPGAFKPQQLGHRAQIPAQLHKVL